MREINTEKKKRWVSLYVENRIGVLARISGMMSGKSYNISSITVGVTEDPTVSRMTIGLSSDDATFEQIKKQLNRCVEVIKLNDITDAPTHMKEILFVKIHECSEFEKGEIFRISQVFGAKAIPYQERRQFMNRLMPEHGSPKTMTYLPENEPELMMILKRERFKRSYHATAGNLEEYLDKLEKTTLREKLKRAKTVVSTQEVSSHKRGLER